MIKLIKSSAIYSLALVAVLCFFYLRLNTNNNISSTSHQQQCNYSEGRWVPSDRCPLYNSTTCSNSTIITSSQDCTAHGRPDTGYLRWRWRPHHCDGLPGSFDATAFLNLIRNKHLAYIGDSLARNQLESLLCLLSTTSTPELVYQESHGVEGDKHRFRRWLFPSHNVTVSLFWSPFLVSAVERSKTWGMNTNDLYLDSLSGRWPAALPTIDIVGFSFGHWFLQPAVYHENGRVIGCNRCSEHQHAGYHGVFRAALRTSLKEVSVRSYNADKLVVVTTFTPSHFEGEWDKNGACPRAEPYKEGAEVEMPRAHREMRRIEMEEVEAAAEAEAARGGRVRFQLLDVTRMSLMRPDGHPGAYMYRDPAANVSRFQDCLHWCLPGPIDAWNEILQEIVKKWRLQ